MVKKELNDVNIIKIIFDRFYNGLIVSDTIMNILI